MDTNTSLLREMIDGSDNIVFFGGAGVSTESGIPDFRGQDGLYSIKYKYPPETILSRTFFLQRTTEFFEFYRDKMLYPDARPNAAHYKLAELERAGKLKAVITQNVDSLHQMAGSVNVLELHGSVHRNYCAVCGKPHDFEFVLNGNGVPRCECGGVVKPDVTLYEEAPDEEVLIKALDCLSAADMLIIGGTSLTVYPAAGLVRYFKGGRDRIVIINKSATAMDNRAGLVINGSIGQTLELI